MKVEGWIWVDNDSREEVVDLIQNKRFEVTEVVNMSKMAGANFEGFKVCFQGEVETTHDFITLEKWWTDTIYTPFHMFTDEGEFYFIDSQGRRSDSYDWRGPHAEKIVTLNMEEYCMYMQSLFLLGFAEGHVRRGCKKEPCDLCEAYKASVGARPNLTH
jgi:hypothetical protein